MLSQLSSAARTPQSSIYRVGWESLVVASDQGLASSRFPDQFVAGMRSFLGERSTSKAAFPGDIPAARSGLVAASAKAEHTGIVNMSSEAGAWNQEVLATAQVAPNRSFGFDGFDGLFT